MHNNINKIQTIRDRQLRWGFRAIAIVGFFALIVSLSRAFQVGWQNIMALHVSLYLAIMISIMLERHLSFFVRASILVVIVYIKGVAGLIFWGLTGSGITALTVCCILCTMGFGVRAGIVSAIISVVSACIIGMAFHLNHLSLQFDPNLYLNSITAWATGVITIVLSAGLIVIALGTMNNQLLVLIKKLDQRNQELLRTNEKLEEEIQERERLFREKTELQNKLQRVQKMEVVANIAGGVAHDLNNVLAGAINYPDLLCMRIPPDSPLREPLEKIKKSAVKAAAIVSDLLALVRRGIVTKKIANINLLISEYLNSPEFEKLKSYHSDVAVETFLDENLLNIEGSPIHITKAIMNLISNGAEAIFGSGKLTITTRNCMIEHSFMGYDGEITPGEYVVLEITDTGSGMSKEDIEKVFEPFYSKKVLGKSGTGLGMTVVWGVVKDHQGHIEIQSTKGIGTSLRIYFPASKEKIVYTNAYLPFGNYKGNGESILVIDDMAEQREVAMALLATLNYSVTALPSGEEAIQYLKKNPVDLVMLDMIMYPGMDGLDTYREIVKLYPFQKAIIATGYCETERIKEARKLGSGNCLIKPFTLEKLGKIVKSELKNIKASSYLN